MVHPTCELILTFIFSLCLLTAPAPLRLMAIRRNLPLIRAAEPNTIFSPIIPPVRALRRTRPLRRRGIGQRRSRKLAQCRPPRGIDPELDFAGLREIRRGLQSHCRRAGKLANKREWRRRTRQLRARVQAGAVAVEADVAGGDGHGRAGRDCR